MTASAADTGRNSPVARLIRDQGEDESSKQDKSYRRYASNIERTLTGFEPARFEWPDYISFLGRLLKVLQAHPPVVDSLPHKSLLATRLAQCLKPTLPSGVHQKALEVYAFVFSLIGRHSLAHDVHIYLPGLCPVLGFASLSLRPFFLSLVETYILPVDGQSLRPGLKGLIMGLLPGLEEEAAEDFDRTLSVIDRFHEQILREPSERLPNAVDGYFWQCFFLASISSASRRQGALTYLSKRLPVLTPETNEFDKLSVEAQAVVAPEPGLLIRCMIYGLEDDQMLVQRGFLDLLLSHLPLNSPVLSSLASENDVIRLVGAATSVVGRRDMSLNRRLWTWFLGPHNEGTENDGEVQESPRGTQSGVLDYFARHGAQRLSKSILAEFQQSPTKPSARARPFRTCLSLMDRWEIGNVIIPHIFVPAMRNIQEYRNAAPEQDFQELLRSASSFFDGIESRIIWGQIIHLLSAAEADKNVLPTSSQLVAFITDHFNVREADMLVTHVPLATLCLLDVIDRAFVGTDTDSQICLDALMLLEKFVNLLPDHLFRNNGASKKEPDQDTFNAFNIRALYPNESARSIGEELHHEYGDAILQRSLQLFKKMLDISPDSDATVLSVKILSTIAAKTGDATSIDVPSLVNLVEGCLSASTSRVRPSSFATFSALLTMFVIFSSIMPNTTWRKSPKFTSLLSLLTGSIWEYLSPGNPRHHVEATRCLWQMQELLELNHSIEAFLSVYFADAKKTDTVTGIIEHARRFAVLWTHTSVSSIQQSRGPAGVAFARSFSVSSDLSKARLITGSQTHLFRPMLLLLDLCDEGDAELRIFVKTWLDSLPNASAIFDMFITMIDDFHFSAKKMRSKFATKEFHLQLAHASRDAEGIYYIRHLNSLLTSCSDHVWSAMLEARTMPTQGEDAESLLVVSAKLCIEMLEFRSSASDLEAQDHDSTLLQVTSSLLMTLIAGPVGPSLQTLKLELPLLHLLRKALDFEAEEKSTFQVSLLDLTLAALRFRSSQGVMARPPQMLKRPSSMETIRNHVKSPAIEGPTSGEGSIESSLITELVHCIQHGLQSPQSAFILDSWIQFLIEIIPLLGPALFQCIIPLTEAICKRIQVTFEHLASSFHGDSTRVSGPPEPSLNALLRGLDYVLMRGHQYMLSEETRTPSARLTEPSQGFFANVSGVFSGEAPKSRPSPANSRLTVTLCFQDALRICLSIWSWGAYGPVMVKPDVACQASFAYASQRLRNKTRRILDRMFAVEGLECLEALVVAWANQTVPAAPWATLPPAINLLHVLDSSTPKHVMPSLFNSLYSRTSPASLESSRLSTLTSDLTDVEIIQFLLQYTTSLDDDAMDEIWSDCMTFLRDVLANPLPHSQVLPSLLQFLTMLSEKVDKTNFGEQRKMRRELGDIFLRLLTATFTTRPSGVTLDATVTEGDAATNGERGEMNRKRKLADIISTLPTLLPRLGSILTDNERLLAAASTLASNVFSPLIHSRSFPENLQVEHLLAWQALVQLHQVSRIWRKDLIDLFMHPKLFATSPQLAAGPMISLVRQVALNDKERINDLCGRINAPTSAGIMFGVGASAARLEADKKTQLILRRMAYLILAAEDDYAVSQLGTIEEKMSELFLATSASSPSSITRAEIYMVLRAIVLKTSPIHLTSIWPILSTELRRALLSAVPRSADFEAYNVPGVLQACKLLDLLIMVNTDEFQMIEWLFITDTTDAVYRPAPWTPVALADDLAEELGGEAPLPDSAAMLRGKENGDKHDAHIPVRLLDSSYTEMGKEDFATHILKPFFAQLSMHAYEATYSMKQSDLAACRESLLNDLFDDGTIVG